MNSIKTLYDPDASSEARNPLQALVSDIPDSTLGEMEHWRPDPALILEDSNPRRYQELFKEGEKIMPKYNGELSAAIKLDHQEEANTGECLCRCGDSMLPGLALEELISETP